MPALPDADVLAQRAVSAARHVAEDPVEQELTRRVFDRTTFFDRRRSKDRIDRRVQVGDHESGTWEAGGLVNEKMGSSGIAVVGNEEAGGC